VEHPFFEVPITPEQVPVFQDSEEGILNQVFTQFTVAIHPVKKTIQRSLITLEEQTQPVEVPFPDPDHQCIVRKRFQIWGSGFQVG